MELTSTASTRIALALLCGLFAVSVYRATTQSITTEEALAFDQRIRPPIRDILPHYQTGNHLLLTLLIKRSVGLFRLSEFSFRLPSLLFGALYLWAVYRISRRTLGTGRLFVAGAALLSLNPLVREVLSAGNAHGMALAFWMWSALLLIEYLEFGPTLRFRNLNLAGLCLGLSAAAELGFAFPVVGLAIAFLIAAAVRGQFRWAAFTERLIATAIVTAFILLVIPLSHAEVGDLDLCCCALGKSEYAPIMTGAKSLVAVLRRDAQDRHIRIGASPALSPILTFYRARYRLANWEPMRQLPLNGDFDYYALFGEDVAKVRERRLQVLYDDGKLVLARSNSIAP